MNGGEEARGASVCGAWPAVSLALPEDPWMGNQTGAIAPMLQMKKWSLWGHGGQYVSWGESCLLGYHFSHYAFIFVTVMGLRGCHACNRAFLMAQTVKNLPRKQETQIQSLGWKYPLEKGMATHSSILVWEISMDRGAWQATVHRVAELDMTEQLTQGKVRYHFI